ncbi:MAG: aminoacyl-histidine dipeptidase [Tidjanibacter sp.]|nr:aminoacyl-histidine dipeptidase [Tidjanibacter sp.]
MNKELLTLEPQSLWTRFAEICDVPRPSYHEEKIREYLVEFAKKNNIEYTVDKGNNIIMRKPATEGMENRKTIVLQAHVDMVPQKNNDKVFDFTTDAIQPYIDGEFVTADGTTLGADNGIGISAILAVLESKTIKHGNIEALFTATEETGMDGANGLEPGVLKADILLNLDSEEEGELCIGCAGGLDFNATIPYESIKLQNDEFTGFELEITGLKGGHSGIDIILQRANANKLLARFLKNTQEKYGVILSHIDGGSLRNAIPREARATVAVLKRYKNAFKKAVKKYEALYNKEYAGIEDHIEFNVTPCACPKKCIDLFDQCNFVDAIICCPNGVVKMDPSIPNMVQTSTNLARVVSERGRFHISALLRSSVDSEKEDLALNMKTVLELANGRVKLSGGYQGWAPNPHSVILKTMSDGYENLFGKRPSVGAVHAGLECGIIGGKYPEMDMISFGPSIFHPHSPNEKVDIASVGRFWQYLVYTLENAPSL